MSCSRSDKVVEGLDVSATISQKGEAQERFQQDEAHHEMMRGATEVEENARAIL